jgi:hypothetical protein
MCAWTAEVRSLHTKAPWNIQSEDASSLPNSDTKFQQEASHLVDEPRSLAHISIPNAMQRVACALLRLPDLREAHRWPGDCFGDRCSVDHVVLVGLHVRLHELCGDDLDRVTRGLELTCQPLGSWTTLHPNKCSRRVREVGKQSVALELAVQHRLTYAVEADDVEGVLPNIDAVYRESFNALLHGGLLPQLLGYSVLLENRSGPSHYF